MAKENNQNPENNENGMGEDLTNEQKESILVKIGRGALKAVKFVIVGFAGALGGYLLGKKHGDDEDADEEPEND